MTQPQAKSSPKFAIISASALVKENRWDAEFHILNQRHAQQAEKLKKQFSVSEACDILQDEDLFELSALKALTPLLRGNRYASPPGRRELLTAAKEYPHLSLAILSQSAPAALASRITETTAKLSRLRQRQVDLARVLAAEEGAKGTSEEEKQPDTASVSLPGLTLSPLPQHLQHLADRKHFVANVVYVSADGDLTIPVHTGEELYVADCWVISKEDVEAHGLTSEERIEQYLRELVAEGGVPVPVRSADLGQALGMLGDGLPDHRGNYGRGWRS